MVTKNEKKIYCWKSFWKIGKVKASSERKLEALRCLFIPFSPVGKIEPFRYGRFAVSDTLIQRNVSIGIIKCIILFASPFEVIADCTHHGMRSAAFTTYVLSIAEPYHVMKIIFCGSIP